MGEKGDKCHSSLVLFISAILFSRLQLPLRYPVILFLCKMSRSEGYSQDLKLRPGATATDRPTIKEPLRPLPTLDPPVHPGPPLMNLTFLRFVQSDRQAHARVDHSPETFSYAQPGHQEPSHPQNLHYWPPSYGKPPKVLAPRRLNPNYIPP